MRIAIIGAGNLGLAIANGILHSGNVQSLYLSRRNLEALKSYEEKTNVQVTHDNKEAVRNSDVILLTVQPSKIEPVLAEIREELGKEHVILSAATGVSIARIEALVGTNLPIIRCMPNTAIAVGKSMTCLCANKSGSEKMELACEIFDGVGATLVIPESRMQAATVICASGIAFWMRMVRATTQGAIQLGFEAKNAHELAVQTCLGAASLLISSGRHPEEEIDRVTTPRGCTIEGLNEMEHQGLSSSLIRGMLASYEKIETIKNY